MGSGLLIIGILQVILMFKLWGMCNDVRKMRKYFIPEERLSSQQSYDYKVGMKVHVNSLNTEAVITKMGSSMAHVKIANGGTTETYLSDLTPID